MTAFGTPRIKYLIHENTHKIEKVTPNCPSVLQSDHTSPSTIILPPAIAPYVLTGAENHKTNTYHTTVQICHPTKRHEEKGQSQKKTCNDHRTPLKHCRNDTTRTLDNKPPCVEHVLQAPHRQFSRTRTSRQHQEHNDNRHRETPRDGAEKTRGSQSR